MKKRITLSLIMALCLFLTACSCKHEWNEASCLLPKTCAICGETEGDSLGHNWQDATCTEPKTCTLCGETNGETLDHNWQDATCAAPKTCSLCKETVGESLPHTWVEANYQDPRHCTVCNATEGQAMEADFDKYGLKINMSENKHYTEKTETSSSYYEREPYWPSFDYTKKTQPTISGETYICNYRIFDSDENHKAVEGYEWRAFDLEIDFLDEDIEKYDVQISYRVEDYYNIEYMENSVFDISGTEWDYLSGFTQGWMVNYHGMDYPVVHALENHGSRWFKQYVETENGEEIEVPGAGITVTLYFCVPIDYDGIVFGFIPPTDNEKTHIYEYQNEDLLLMRLGNTLDCWWNGGVVPSP